MLNKLLVVVFAPYAVLRDAWSPILFSVAVCAALWPFRHGF